MVAYLVDGNNVMGQRVGWHRDKAGARHRLLDDLARFARATGEPVAVVFDGAPDDEHPDGSTYQGVRVHYAARGSDADTRIEHLVEHAPKDNSLLVVTSDRRLADAIRRHGVRVMRSGEFRRGLDALAGGGAAAGEPTTTEGAATPAKAAARGKGGTTRRAWQAP